MRTDTAEFWNDTWSDMAHTFADHDQALANCAARLKPGRALDLGCGSGGNAIWLAERGWRVTAVDFSEVAIEKAGIRAADSQVQVEFIVSDAAAFKPNGLYDLITSFYIHLWPARRAKMLAAAAKVLAPGGRLLFVSHDKTAPPSGWSREDLESLTTPEMIVSELPSLRIERAEVIEETGSHSACMADSQDSESHSRHDTHEEPGHHSHSHGAATIVIALKDE